MEGNHRPSKYRPQVERSVEWSRSETQLLASAYESLVPRVRACATGHAEAPSPLASTESAVRAPCLVAGA